ncbi:MAG TPA: Hsp20/alpha crystallin family protein [Candidatus Paceibacterota bacterium]|nr:Hsp20/alpha crystallin family protein [Candidatus Shapirobacteria bacterium]HOE15206.1 Hsp20/alpha crystallin family protein [Candidatus Paceibacterota bacterium]
MSVNIVPKKMLSFPSFSLPSLWDDDEDWFITPSTQNGLTVSEDDNKIYVEAAVPGIDPKNVEVTFQDGYLWIRAETKEEERDKKKKYYRQASQSFSYRVAVPGEVDPSKEPEATYKHGVMTITFNKSPKAQPKKIPIKTVEE